MRRFLSWVVMAVCAYICLIICGTVSGIITSLLYRILSSTTLVILFILLGGAGGLTAVSFICLVFAGLVTKVSDLVCVSAKGTRYRVGGIIIMVLYAFLLIGILVGFVQGGDKTAFIIRQVVYMLFGLFLFIASYSRDKAGD